MIRALRLLVACGLLLGALAAPAIAEPGAEGDSAGLEPTHEPMPPAPKPVYTTDYLFAVTRAVSNSTLAPAARVPLFFLTIPVDVAFLPIEVIAGFFPGG